METAYRKSLIVWLAAAAALAVAGCSGQGFRAASAELAAHAPDVVAAAEPAAQPPAESAPVAAPQQPEPAPPAPAPLLVARISCPGTATQGGAVICRANPNATVTLDGKPIAVADGDGVAVVGLTREQKSPAKIGVRVTGLDDTTPLEAFATVDIAKRHDTVSKLSMECNKIAPQSDEEKKRAEVAWLKKQDALKIFAAPQAPVALEGPVPMKGVVYSSSFGATRTYEPKTKDCKPTVNVHNGTDIAVGTGTPIVAPMAGTVILADPDLYFEGGCVFLDLGRGLVSVTMHMSRIDVKAGDVVKQGDQLGLSGATGRVTGPHLHWGIKYRNVLSSDRGTDIWLDPMLVMQAKPPAD